MSTTKNNAKLDETTNRLTNAYLAAYNKASEAQAALDAVKTEIMTFSDLTGICNFENEIAKVAVYESAGRSSVDTDKLREYLGDEDLFQSFLKQGKPFKAVKATVKKAAAKKG